MTKYTIPYPGNFGGTVWGNGVMQWSKESLENLLSHRLGYTVFNLGRGAHFKGTTPKHPKAVSLPEPDRPKQDVIDEIVDRCPIYTSRQFEEAWEKAALIDRLYDYCEDIKNVMREEEDFEDFGYLVKLTKLFKPAEISDGITMLLRGTLMNTVISFEYYLNRAIDEKERKIMWQVFVEEFSTEIDELRDRAIEIFTDLEEGEPWETDFIR